MANDMWQAITLGILLLLSTGCRSSSPAHLVTPAPADFHGFPCPAHNGGIWAEAIYASSLVDENFVPVFVRVGLRGEAKGAPRLTAETLVPHLYLQDGTILDWVPEGATIENGPSPPGRARDRPLRLTLLESWERSAGGFLIFRIPPSVRVKPPHALCSDGDRHHEVDLRNSLLSFDALTDTGLRPLRLGLTTDRIPRR